MSRKSNRRIWIRLILLLVLVLAWLGSRHGLFDFISPDSPTELGEVETRGGEVLARAYQNRTSNLKVEFVGRVERLLSDDTEGSRHQRFIVRLAGGQTILVAHNLDLAERVPIKRQDLVRVFGVYEWNQRGGVVHWTHHDPDGRREGGWIELDGRKYE